MWVKVSFCFILLTNLISITMGRSNVKRSINTETANLADVVLGQDELCFTTCKVPAKQLVVVNVSADTAVIVDPNTDQYAFLCGDGKALFYDKSMDLCFEAPHGNWSPRAFDFISGFQMPEFMEKLNPIDASSIGPSHGFITTLKNIMGTFGQGVRDMILNTGANFFTTIQESLALITHPIRDVLGPILDFGTDTWLILKGGLLCFMLIFKWVGKFVSAVTGGINTLFGGNVKFGMRSILGAENGIQSFGIMLTSIMDKFDISKILRSIIHFPSRIAHFVAGLGGEAVNGVTGLYTVMGTLIDLIELVVKAAKSITYAIISSFKFLANLIRSFFSSRPRSLHEVTKDANHMLRILDKQDEKFQNRAALGTFRNFWEAAKGEGSLKIHGINVGTIIKTLVEATTNTAIDLIGKIVHLIKPLLKFNSTELLVLSNPESNEPRVIMHEDLEDKDSVADNAGSPDAKKMYYRIRKSIEHEDEVSMRLNSDNVATQKLENGLLNQESS